MPGINSKPFKSSGNENVARILALLKAGEENIGLTEVDNAILLVGKSGSGKTNLSHFLAGNNKNLISEEQETGDFIIRDKSEKITDENTTVSKTIPELIHDLEKKTIYIDCPDFTNGDPNDDIAAAYFTKKEIEKVKNIKIVMVVNYSSFRSGSDGEDIRSLAERVITLMKNIDKYVNSVALVVTEVDNKYKKGVLVPDEVVIENIAKLLSKFKEPLNKSNLKVSDENAFPNDSQKLFDALLQKNGTEYTRLGIFRRPDAAGPISEIELLQDGKNTLLDMLKNNLKYAQVDSANIGYAVSDKSKNVIIDWIAEASKSIAADMSQIKDMLIDYFKQLEIDLFDDDIYAVKNHFETASAILAKIKGINKSAKASELASLMEKYFTESWKLACEPILHDMKKLGKLIDFLQDVSGKQFDSFVLKWVGELDDAVFWVENSLKWFNLMVALYERSSDYDVQKDTKRFPVPKFQSSYGPLENHADFLKFYSMISNHRLLGDHYFKELQKVIIDEIKVRYFNQVIESVLLRPPLKFSMFHDQGPRLQVSGEFVKISDVVQNSLYPASKSVQVLATHTVFIDANMTKKNDISIIAPRWVVVDFREINLNGSPGEEWSPNKAPSDSCPGCNGENGLPGKPGKSAGFFFGLGDEFENASQLQILAIGGTGGNGQHGGDGRNGAAGNTYNIEWGHWNMYCSSGQSCNTDIVHVPQYGCDTYDVFHTMYGSSGGRGGDAGRGGAPGLGGFAGNITILGLGMKKPSILQVVTKGKDGEFGLHGTCGAGGEGGYNKKSKVCVNCDTTEWNTVYSEGKSSDGDKGVCLYFSSLENSNLKGRASPVAIHFLYPPASIISDFRTELVKNFDNCVRKSHSIKFYKMLQRQNILMHDNIGVIFSEFQQLEKLYNKFPRNLSKTIYKFIFKRIEDISKQSGYSSNPHSSKLLELLPLVVNSKLIRLEKNPHARLAFNHREYFDALKTVDLDTISRYFADRTIKEIGRTEDVVKIVSSDIFHTIEHTISEICSFSSNGDLEKLKHHLLKLKLFSKLKSADDVLDLVTSLTKVDLALIQTMSITKIFPYVEVSTSAVDGSMIRAKLAAIKEVTEKKIYAIKGAMLREIRSLQSLGDEFDPTVDQLRNVEATLRSRWAVVDESESSSMVFSLSDEIQTIRGMNSALVKKHGPDVNESVVTFENAVKVIQWNVDLHDASAKIELNGTDLTSSIDDLRENDIHFDETARDVVNTLESLISHVKVGLTGDLYKLEGLIDSRRMVSRYLGELKSKIHTLVAEFGIDEDLSPIVENFDQVLNQLVTLFDEVLPGEHNRALLNNLHFQLEQEKKSEDQVQNYFTKVTGADKLFYEYEHLIEACKTSVFPFDILTNSRLAFAATPHVDESSIQHRSTIASNIKQLEAELDSSWEQRIQNVTLAKEFKRDNENGAFFVWRNKHHKDSISKLLRGRAVVLKASLDVVGDKQQWLKFDNIGLRFTSGNSTVQQLLDEDLKYFNVSMTHMGDSHFSLCNRVRLVHHDATQFSHSFNETTAQVVDPVKSSLRPVLSPFATWIFRLHPIDEDVTFSILNPYRKLDIGIELEGNATFVDSVNRTMCQKIVLSDFDIHQLPSRLENDQEIAKKSSSKAVRRINQYNVDDETLTLLTLQQTIERLIGQTRSIISSAPNLIPN